MKTLAALLIPVLLLAGCSLTPVGTEAPFTPKRLAKISRDTGNPYTNYENVWAATEAVMEKNFAVALADKARGRIKSQPERDFTSFIATRRQAFATIVYDKKEGVFTPEIKIITFIDTSEPDPFSDRPTPRQWRQLIESDKRATQLEEDVRRILLPGEYDKTKPPAPKPSVGEVNPS